MDFRYKSNSPQDSSQSQQRKIEFQHNIHTIFQKAVKQNMKYDVMLRYRQHISIQYNSFKYRCKYGHTPKLPAKNQVCSSGPLDKQSSRL